MNEKTFFVMLYSRDAEKVFPMTGDDDTAEMFPSLDAARDAAEQNPIGQAHGYGIFNLEEEATQ